MSCCTTLTIAHSDAFRAHDDHSLAERVDSQDTAEYALSRSSSLDDDARSGSPPRPRRTRTARRRVNNRKGYLRELVGGHWRRKAHCKRSIDALTCVCKQEELARPDLFEPPVWPVSPPLPIRDFGNWYCQTRRRHDAHQALPGRARREALCRHKPRQLGRADRDPPRFVVLGRDVLLLGHRANVRDVKHRAALQRVVEP